MAKIINSEYETLPELKGICDVDPDWRTTIDFNNQFDRFSDERSPGMKRFFHLQNSVASVKFESNDNADHGFTGIFRGAASGVFAFSPLAPLLKNAALVNNFIGTFPVSFGLKPFTKVELSHFTKLFLEHGIGFKVKNKGRLWIQLLLSRTCISRSVGGGEYSTILLFRTKDGPIASYA